MLISIEFLKSIDKLNTTQSKGKSILFPGKDTQQSKHIVTLNRTKRGKKLKKVGEFESYSFNDDKTKVIIGINH